MSNVGISVTDALALSTGEIVASYTDFQGPKSFGRSYFTEVATATKLASIVSQRGLNLVASDVNRSSRGNLNVFDRSTQSMVFPPYFSEYFNIVDLDVYDKLTMDGFTSMIAWGQFMDTIASKMNFMMEKVDRRYELMCWQLFNTGIVTINDGSNVQYGRKAGSLFDPGVAAYWTVGGIDPIKTTLTRGSAWLNETGKMVGNTIDVIFSENVWNGWCNNDSTNKNDLKFNNNLTVLANNAVRDSTGKTFLGSTTYGAFNYNFFTYSDFYEDENGVKYKYLDPRKLVMLPSTPAKNVLTYTAVPADLRKGLIATAGKFHSWDEITRRAHDVGIDSAGIPILGAVDQIYTEVVMPPLA